MNALRLVTLILVAGLAVPAPFSAQDERGQFNDVAADLAGAIIKSSRGAPFRIAAAVVDFQEQNGEVTALGVRLADQFSAALSKSAVGFEVIDRNSFSGSHALYRPTAEDMSDPKTMECYINEPSTAVVVRGTVNEESDRLVLWIRGQRLHETIFDQRITIPATSELKQLMAEPREHRPTPTWVNPEHPPAPTVEPAPDGKNSLGEPGCVYCPTPQYVDRASVAKVEGTVLPPLLSSDEWMIAIAAPAVDTAQVCGQTNQP